MTILQISIEVNSGSVGRIAEQIGEKVINENWESYITYARNNRVSTSKTIKIGTKSDVLWHGVMTRIFDNHAFESKRATRNLLRDIDKINPDIIHLHHLHGYFINIEILFNYLKNKNIPIVWTFHDCWSYTGHCAYYSYVNCNKWETHCHSCPQKTEYPKSILFDRSKKNYTQKKKLFNLVKSTIVPVSHWLGNEVKKSFLKNQDIRVIQNGIDINIFRPQENLDELQDVYNVQDKFVILGVASTWEKRKGLQEFIKLSKIIPDDVQIILVGISKNQKKELPSGIIAIERTENVNQLADLYSLADVFVNPTLEEALGLTNIEAQACGTPVITYNSGGSPETVSPATGMVIEKENTVELLKAIMSVKDKGKNFYSENCRKRAEQFFDKDDRFNDYIELYKEILEQSPHTL